MIKQKIYISSKITGLEKEVYTKAFNDAEQLIITMGHTPINPLKHVPQDISYEDQMHICLTLVDISDVVMMVGDWVDSTGATRELIHGAKQEKKILYYEEQKEIYETMNHKERHEDAGDAIRYLLETLSKPCKVTHKYHEDAMNHTDFIATPSMLKTAKFPWISY